MNIISFSRHYDKDTKATIGLQQVELIMTPNAQGYILPVLREAFEIPMLKAERTDLPDGQIKIAFELNDEQAEQLRRSLMLAMLTDNGFNNPN